VDGDAVGVLCEIDGGEKPYCVTLTVVYFTLSYLHVTTGHKNFWMGICVVCSDSILLARASNLGHLLNLQYCQSYPYRVPLRSHEAELQPVQELCLFVALPSSRTQPETSSR